jgi:hypothetical protein
MMNCPNGFLFGNDWNEHPECDNCVGDPYWKCGNKRSMCVGKADFGSEIIATREAREYEKRSNYRVEMHAYQCSYCNGWHIGRG